MQIKERQRMLLSSLEKERNLFRINQSKITFAKRFIKDVLGFPFEKGYIEYVKSKKIYRAILINKKETIFYITSYYKNREMLRQHYVVTCVMNSDEHVITTLIQRNRLKKVLTKFNSN